MSKFLLITKINILRSLNDTRINNSKYKSERRKKTIKTIGVALIVLYIMFYVYYLASSLIPAFITLGKPLYLIGFLFTICSIYILFSNMLKIKNVLFNFKDYDLLMSLPIKRNTIIASKLVSLYVFDLLCTFIIMIPGYIAYIRYLDLPNDWLFFILLLTIPIIPILVSTIIGIILSWITSFFKNKNIGSYVVNILLVSVVLFISFRTSMVNEVEMANLSVNMVDSFSHYYLFTSLFVDLLGNLNLLNLCIYFVLPIIFGGIFVLFINKGYIHLRTRLLKINIKNDYEVKRYRHHSTLKSLYIKEIKKYFSNSLYVINTSFGPLLLIVLIVSILLSGDYMVERIGGLMNFGEMDIKIIYFIMISLICAMSSTTNSSVSLEGKSLWIMKMIPVNIDKIFLSKILVNLTILVPTILVCGTFFGIYLHLSFSEFILIYLMPFSYALFASFGGLLCNIMFPKFDFENEIKVIKQSLAVFITILLGIIMVIVPFKFLDMNISSIMLITSVMFLIDIIILIILHFYGNNKFVRL